MREFLIGTRKVVYQHGSYLVMNATTDSIIAKYSVREWAIEHAIRTSMIGR